MLANSNLVAITVTGAADDCAIDDLIRLGRRYPLIEVAVLYSPGRSGAGRYPSRHWLEAFAFESERAGIARAIHLCGDSVADFVLDPQSYSARLVSKFSRVQLNFNASRIGLSPRQFSDAIERSAVPVITQVNEQNSGISSAIGARRHHILFDRSGGIGRLPESWPDRWPDKAVNGWAGGLSPENIEHHIGIIARHADECAFTVDAETALRTAGDKFDMSKAEDFVQAALRGVSVPA